MKHKMSLKHSILEENRGQDHKKDTHVLTIKKKSSVSVQASNMHYMCSNFLKSKDM